MLKNALLYITRKKTKFIIILLMFIVILVSIYSCLVINSFNDKLEQNIYNASNSSIILEANNGDTFKLDIIKNISNIVGVEKYNYEYEKIAKLEKGEVIKENQKIEVNDIPEDYKNVIKIYGVTDSKVINEFVSEAFNIIKGRHIEKNDVNKIVIHEQLAKKNGYDIGSKVLVKKLNNNNSKDQANGENNSIEYEVVGIFSGKKEEKYTGLTSDYTENMAFADYSSVKEKEEKVNRIIYFASDPKKIDKVIEDIKKTGINTEEISISKNTKGFDDTISSITSMKGIIIIITYSVVLGSIIILSMILILWIRERIHEIGILLSIGVRRYKIMAQFILELIYISIPSIITTIIVRK